MGSVNKWIGIGNLGADPELKYTPSNRAVCNLSLACNEVWKDKQGKKQERVEWVRVVVWGEMAEHCAKYLAKGRQVYVEGRLSTNSWDDQKTGQKRYSTNVVAERVVFLGGGEGAGRRGGGGGSRQAEDGGGWSGGGGGGDDQNLSGSQESTGKPGGDFDDSDIPF